MDKDIALEGVSFELYRQVIDAAGNPRKDNTPISWDGESVLVTDENGVVPKVTIDLTPGTYYLTEKETLPGDTRLSEDLCFTIGADGTVIVNSEGHDGWLSVTEENGTVAYQIMIPNGITPVEVTVSGTKILRGRDMEAGEFTFMMTPVDLDGNAIGPAVTTHCEAAEAFEAATFTFDPLVYTYEDYETALIKDTAAKTAYFYYVVAEEVPESAAEDGYNAPNDIYYDRGQFLVVVKLTFSENGLVTIVNYYTYDGTIPTDLQPQQNPNVTVNASAQNAA